MDLLGSRRKLELFALCAVYLSRYFNMMAGVNVAHGKPSRASSLFNSSAYNEVSGPACLAVNGNTGTVFKPISQFPNSPACVHTGDGDYTPYWEVDLGQQYIISNITVCGRQENGRNMLRKATVSVDNKPCYTFPSDYLQPFIADISCNPPLTGRKARIQKINDTDLPFLAVCQVQVWGCNSGFFGADCTNTCGNCSAGTCEPSSGVCPQGCVAGYQAPNCKDTCSDKTYGFGCNGTCGNCAGNAKCKVYNGSCETGCAAGYRLPLCREVCNGSYGTDCRYPCGNCADGTKCNVTSGECPHGCKAGYSGPYCNESCRNKTFGPGCNGNCGHCVNDSQCDIYDGRCEAGCAAGYKPPLCTAACSPGTYGEQCSKTCGNCSNPNDCNIYNGYCALGCGAGYSPPLCQQACSNKTYGENYKFTCGRCRGFGICDIYKGICDTCVSNFALPYCKDCRSGFYGPDCNKTCGNCSNGTTCNAVSGVCPNGCGKGHQGTYCNETCSNRTFGENCKYSCGKCGGSGICDIYNGACDTCVPNVQLPYCIDTDCQNERSRTEGPIAGAVSGSIASCVVVFLLGILFMRCRLHQSSNSKASGARFLPSTQPEFSSSPPEESRPPRPNSYYELSSQPANVYDSLKSTHDDNVYTKLNAKKGKCVR